MRQHSTISHVEGTAQYLLRGLAWYPSTPFSASTNQIISTIRSE